MLTRQVVGRRDWFCVACQAGWGASPSVQVVHGGFAGFVLVENSCRVLWVTRVRPEGELMFYISNGVKLLSGNSVNSFHVPSRMGRGLDV